MPETIYKLQPNRTVALRGFDHLGASAAVHGAEADGFQVTGQFRDASDFAVVVLYDADNFYEHPRVRYLPDFDFSGLTLQFDASYSSSLMHLDARRYPTIDWPYLDAITDDGSPVRVRLSDHAEVLGAEPLCAGGEFEVVGPALEGYDRLTVWFENLAFDYIVPGKTSTEYAFYAGTPGTQHQIAVAERVYIYVEQEGDTSAGVAAELIARVNAGAGDAEISAAEGEDAWKVRIRTKLDTGEQVAVSASGYLIEQLWHVRATTVARELARQMREANYGAAGTLFSLTAVADGAKVRVSTRETGKEGNLITLYAVWKNGRLTADRPEVALGGGSSAEALRVRLEFGALGLSSVRQMWLTLAPALAEGKAYDGEAWTAAFSNWTVTGPEEVKRLKVPAAGSVWVGSLDGGCEYSDGWALETGFFTGGAARVAGLAGRVLRVRYTCEKSHDLWLGTSLYFDRGRVRVELDGVVVQAELGTALLTEPAVVTRRRVMAGVEAGEHVVKITTLDDRPFYFESLLAAVEGPMPEPLAAQTFETPALDYSTDHAYKLPPSRILWNLRQLGTMGPLNEYIGVFWWNERKRVNGRMAQGTVTFGGGFAAGDQVFVKIGARELGKTVLSVETPEQIARHFELMINGSSVGVWAKTAGAVLTVEARAATAAYRYDFGARVERAEGSTGTVAVDGALDDGEMGVWQVDAGAEHGVNEGARAWHRDLYERCAGEGRSVTTAMSMELVEAPPGFAAIFPDGQEVVTATGFGALRSSHCAFRSQVKSFQIKVLTELAGMMAEAGLEPDLQCGEYTWWYFTNYSETNPAGGMAYYDMETMEEAALALGRPLHVFRGPDDDPEVNGGEDAAWLRGRLRDYTSGVMGGVREAVPGVKFEVLYPYDVNHPEPAGIHGLGGRLNRRVNLPLEWESNATAGFDRFKVEALDFGAWSRDLDLACGSLQFGVGLGWPASLVRAMIPVFRGGYPWGRETQYARELGMGGVHLWAFDHVCLYGWMFSEQDGSRAYRMG